LRQSISTKHRDKYGYIDALRASLLYIWGAWVQSSRSCIYDHCIHWR
jgi:hypothetical protein